MLDGTGNFVLGAVDEKEGGNLNFLVPARLRRSSKVLDGGGRGNFLVLADRGDKAATGGFDKGVERGDAGGVRLAIDEEKVGVAVSVDAAVVLVGGVATCRGGGPDDAAAMEGAEAPATFVAPSLMSVLDWKYIAVGGAPAADGVAIDADGVVIVGGGPLVPPVAMVRPGVDVEKAVGGGPPPDAKYAGGPLRADAELKAAGVVMLVVGGSPVADPPAKEGGGPPALGMIGGAPALGVAMPGVGGTRAVVEESREDST